MQLFDNRGYGEDRGWEAVYLKKKAKINLGISGYFNEKKSILSL